MAALGGYLMAKFLWNPDYDQNQAINEFLEGYYGKAARPIRQYIDLLHDRVERENIHVHIFDPPTKPYLDNQLLCPANALWAEAERLVAGDAEILQRVQISRMSVDYAIMECARAELQKPPAAGDTADGKRSEGRRAFSTVHEGAGIQWPDPPAGGAESRSEPIPRIVGQDAGDQAVNKRSAWTRTRRRRSVARGPWTNF